MLKIRKKIFTFNKDEEVYMGHLSIWNKETEVHFYGAINRDYEEKLEEKLNWFEKNRLSVIDKFIQEDDVFNSINQMIENKELEINNQKIFSKITEEDFKNLTSILKINICDGEIQFYYLMVLGEYFLGVQMSAEDDFNNPNFLYLSIETTLESDAEGQKIFKATDISVYEVTIESAEKKSPSSTSNNFLQVYDNKNFFERIVSFFKGLFK